MEISFPASQTRIIAASNVQVSHTGNTTETVLATIAIPAGVMGLNGVLRVTATWGHTNSANNKTLRIRAGGTGIDGTAYITGAATTTVVTRAQAHIGNRNSASSQVGGSPAINASFGSTSVALPTSAIDTTAAFNIYITGLLASSGETVSLENYIVELIIP
jgi:hypothetical protein